ncbi:clavesin-2-like isoform X2 [Tachypleus tridentatus]|uniref:clavesin-2-like isoform X2 n=1 Tax=Tachypleus tridentatus TaxID=6853 RepID=UPI003FD66BC0
MFQHFGRPCRMAEFGWALSDSTQIKAKDELNEHPEERQKAIQVMRELIQTRPDVGFLRTDAAFILRFLRARKFDVQKAFSLYTQYFVYRQKHPSLFKSFNASDLGIKQALLDGFPGVLPNPDHQGRRILLIFTANWDHCRYSLFTIYQAILLSLERLLEDEETQVNGFVIIVDWTEFSFKQSSQLKPKTLKVIIEGLQDCFPARFSGIHFINQPWYVEAALTVMKPFLKDKTKEKIFMHGNNMTTLHSHIHRDILPAELGGLGPPYHYQSWAMQLVGEPFSFSDRNIFWPLHNETPCSSSSPLTCRRPPTLASFLNDSDEPWSSTHANFF